jgi:hypothetical protein
MSIKLKELLKELELISLGNYYEDSILNAVTYLRDMNKIIKELQAENKQLRDRQEWVSVDDRLPEEGQKVISRYTGVYDYDVVTFWRDTANIHFGHQPATHWKPLPSPPQDKEQG